MRERLTAAFIVLSVVLLLGAGLVRTYVLQDLIREQVAGELSQQADLVAGIVDDQEASGGTVDEDWLTVTWLSPSTVADAEMSASASPLPW